MKIRILIISLLVLFFSESIFAQQVWSTNQGDLKIYPIRHASMVWEWNGKTIYIDPVGDPVIYKEFKKPDLILITHSHGDHLSAITLAGINAVGTEFLVPQDVADKLDDAYKEKMQIGTSGESYKIAGLEIETVDAYNYPVTEASRHIKGFGNGFIVNVGGKRIYISGDTSNIPELKAIKNIDAAFLCMNLPYTMDVDEAAIACLTIQPKVVYPYHYRGKDGFSDLNKFAELVAAKNPAIEVRVLAWYPE